MVVGLTGGIGSGKSTVAGFFSALGVPVADADQLARQLVEPASPVLARVVERFGAEVLRDDGSLDRAALGQRIFADDESRHWLEQLLHPLVRRELRSWTQAQRAPYVIQMVPLLLETGMQRQVDRVLVVDCSEQTQLLRVRARDGLDDARIRRILSAQSTREKRLALADDRIDTDCPLDWVEAQVRSLHGRYLAMNSASSAE